MWPWLITGEYKKSSILWMLSFSFCNGSQASILLTANLSTSRHLTNPDVRLNSIPWCTSFHVILSLRTWHIMISILQHARNEHRSARWGWFQSMFRFSSFDFWECWVSLYSLCIKGDFQSYFEGFFMCSLICRSLSRTHLCARSQLTELNTKYKTRQLMIMIRFTWRTKTTTGLRTGSNKTAAMLWS